MSGKTVRIGVIGVGFAQTTQIPGFKNCEHACVTAIASARREHAEEVARQFGIEHVESDWRTLVARDDIDLVSIVTPPVTHCEITLAALEHGKAVLCEKPMAMNADEAWRMTERARETGRLALIDHELRFLPGRLKLHELLRRGEIGKVRHVTLRFRSGARANADRPWQWWSDANQGGGTLGAIGSHAVDGFRWLLGAEVSEVFGSLATHIRERKEAEGQMRPVTTDDEATLLLRFVDSELTEGATGMIALSVVEAGKPEHRLEVFGSDGAFAVTEKGKLRRARADGREWKRIKTGRGDLAPGMSDGGWARGFTEFSRLIVAALREGRNAVEGAATFEDGFRTQLVLDGARRSNESGCWGKIS